MGGISTNRCLVAWAAVLVRILLSGWVVERVVVCGWWVVFGTLLGPEATGLRGRLSLWGVGCAGLFVSGFLAWPIMHGMPLCGVVCGVWGLGLLFENYIVDASIFEKKQFPRIMNLDLAALLMPFWGVGGVVGFRGSLVKCFLIFCGQVFKSTRWMPWH